MQVADEEADDPARGLSSADGSPKNSIPSPTSKADESGRRTRSRVASPLKAPVTRSDPKPEEPVSQKGDPISPEMLHAFLNDRFPARDSEIKQLLGLLGGPSDPLFPLFVYGGASTGKTCIVLEMFRQMSRPFAYSSCRSSHTPRILFESILNQLNKHLRSPLNNYGSFKKCDRFPEFLSFVVDTCNYGSAIAHKGIAGSPMMKGCHEEVDSGVSLQPITYLVFDNVELLLDWSGGFRLISALLRLSELSGLKNLGLIFISNLGPDAFFSGTGLLEPIPIYMDDYTDDDLYQILLKQKPKSELYSSFLSAVLKPFSRVTRRVTELSEALEPLFEKYIEPIRKGIVKPDDQGKRKLFSLIQPHVTSALHQTFSFSYSTDSLLLNGQKKVSGGLLEMDFQLSLCSKYLLIAAFVCSRNPATLDATLFDSGGVSSKKRRRRAAQTVLEKKELERQEKLLKGPGTFPLERLLAIFCCISADFGDEVEEIDPAVANPVDGVVMSADVLMQLSTLVNAKLLHKGSTDPLEGNPRYRCNASEALIQLVSRSVSFPLSRYLYRV